MPTSSTPDRISGAVTALDPTGAGRPRPTGVLQEHRRTRARRAVLAAGLSAAMLVSGCSAGVRGSEEASQESGTVAASVVAAGADLAEPGAGDFDAATRDDEAFNQQFRHEFAEVDGVRMHYVTGGSGPPLVLLAGWPQSWFAWRDLMPALAEEHTVYAVDLPGLGDSDGEPAGYDKATLAQYVHRLVADELALEEVAVVGHDLGAGVGFQYTAQFPDEVSRYAHLDYPLPGPALSADQYRTFSWHIAFHQQERFPEAVVANDVPAYLEMFYAFAAYGGESFGGPVREAPFSQAEVDEFARTYSRPQVLSGGFDLYRTLEQDELDTIAARPSDVPTMVMTAEGLLASTLPTLEPRLTAIERSVEVPGAGHWLMEENPDFVTAELLGFLQP